jgi:hypothetical protein
VTGNDVAHVERPNRDGHGAAARRRRTADPLPSIAAAGEALVLVITVRDAFGNTATSVGQST